MTPSRLHEILYELCDCRAEFLKQTHSHKRRTLAAGLGILNNPEQADCSVTLLRHTQATAHTHTQWHALGHQADDCQRQLGAAMCVCSCICMQVSSENAVQVCMVISL